MSDRGVLFNVFEKTGAKPIFFDGITAEEAKYIALRSQMTLSQMNAADAKTAEAILPFSGLKKITFILLFQIHQTNPDAPHCVCFLSYILPQNQQVFLYSKVPFLKLKAESIIKDIQSEYVHGSGSFPNSLIAKIKEWQVTDKETTAQIEIIEKKVTLSERKEGGSIEFFMSQVKKNEDRAIGALFRNKTVFVTGSEVLVDLIVHSLDLFVPYATLRKISFTRSLVDPSVADIIGISKDLVKHYSKEVIIDVDKKQVKNGQSCAYSKKLIKEIRKDIDRASTIIKESTDKLLNVVGELVEVFSLPEEERNAQIEKVRKKYDPSLVEVAAEIGAQRNPLIREILLESVSNRFVDWIDGL
ncbi:MAG: hypothetical protein ACTSW1_06925 [Candidatus Hodarchaeales archaeon]